ncbi:Os07g0438300, partial [Oryza sativa Japonica Group]
VQVLQVLESDSATLLTSNGHQICIRPPFSAREYLMESSRSRLSNGSSIIPEFHLVLTQSQKQGAASPVMGLWACNFVWDPGPSGAQWGAPQSGRARP